MRLKYLRELLFSKHPYLAKLPYNYSWIEPIPEHVTQLLKGELITIFDIGARNLTCYELDPLRKYINYIGFEADAEECNRINKEQPYFSKQKCLPYFVSGSSGEVEFNLYRARGCSSQYKPDARFARLFANEAQATIERTQTLVGTTLTEICQIEGLESPDFLKLDTQGSELSILEGYKMQLLEVPIIEIEVEFLAQYKNQPLFYKIAEFMDAQGYDLIYLNRVVKQRKSLYTGPARGQPVFGDALFCKREDMLSSLPQPRLAKLVLVLWVLGHRDISFEIFSIYLKGEPEFSELASIFDQKSKNVIIKSFKQFVIGKMDSITQIWLSLRRTNGIRTDHDRCWPFR